MFYTLCCIIMCNAMELAAIGFCLSENCLMEYSLIGVGAAVLHAMTAVTQACANIFLNVNSLNSFAKR